MAHRDISLRYRTWLLSGGIADIEQAEPMSSRLATCKGRTPSPREVWICTKIECKGGFVQLDPAALGGCKGVTAPPRAMMRQRLG
jgi:hypothetical protein